MTSELYQRAATADNHTAPAELRFFVSPDRRRMSAEQIVDSLVAVSGRPLDVEELTFDPDGRRASSNRLTLGVPRRAWMFASLANERDRPSLSLPRARAITDVMEAFGWSGSRQSPRTDREQSPNVLQPGVLANSTASVLLTRAAQGSELAELAIAATSPEQLIDRVFLRVLSRPPSAKERGLLLDRLATGFDQRVLASEAIERPSGLNHQGAFGQTDELGKKIVADPVSVADFFATIHAAVGIDYSKNLYDGDRPVPITDLGHPIAKLFS